MIGVCANLGDEGIVGVYRQNISCQLYIYMTQLWSVVAFVLCSLWWTKSRFPL
jgi:hypothetical protein